MEKELGNMAQSAPVDSGEGRRDPQSQKPQPEQPKFVLFAGKVTGKEILAKLGIVPKK